MQALVQRATETNNNGYIWHTTGSGKTLTSFKAGQILADEESIKKVFFLVDRQDLDSQTITEFNKFQKDRFHQIHSFQGFLSRFSTRSHFLH